MTKELLPCKFCGGKARIEYGYNYDYDGGDRWYVYSADVVCDCGCTLHVDNKWPKEYVSEEHMVDFAIDAWNRSSTTTDSDATQARQGDAAKQLRAMSGYPHTLRIELRKALEDAGIDYWVAQGITFWNCEDGRGCVAYGYQTNDGPKLAVKIVGFTSPSQVIAATLEANEYTIERNVDGSYKCPKCGCVVDYDIRGDDERIITMDDYVIPFNFCPKCGAEVMYE